MIEISELANRREKVIEQMENNSIAILFAGTAVKRSADESYPFTVNRNFFYLTGIEQENSVLMLVKADDEVSEYLFVDEKEEKKEKWTGIRLTTKEAAETSGIKTIFLTSAFEGKVIAALDKEQLHFGDIKNVYLDLEAELKIGDERTTKCLKHELIKNYKINVLDIHDIVMQLRMVKSPAEVEMIRESINITETGIKNILKAMSVGRFEYNLRNIFEFTIKEEYGVQTAFSTIVAAGKNAVILHYPEAKDILRNNDLVLIDLGAAKGNYCADISRTFPINGGFNNTQRMIYEIVLGCNKATINFIRPGITLKELNEFAKNFLAEECYKKGLISSKEEIGTVYYHSVSHHLGLDTHDGTDRTSTLVPGNVITCEPGLYFKEYGIGIRIEDDVLVTEKGREVLSNNIIKEIGDIEKILIAK